LFGNVAETCDCGGAELRRCGDGTLYRPLPPFEACASRRQPDQMCAYNLDEEASSFVESHLK